MFTMEMVRKKFFVKIKLLLTDLFTSIHYFQEQVYKKSWNW